MKEMIKAFICSIAVAATCVGIANAAPSHDRLKATVDAAVRPVMAKDAIPGMSVGVIVAGESRVFNYGLASVRAKKPVTDETLFEVGSVSKTFTATLTSYAAGNGQLSLADPVSKYLPSLAGSEFGDVALVNLATHTPGGLPLQVPDGIRNMRQLMQYFKNWRRTYPAGTYRTYSNLSIGILGVITAKSMGENFDALMEHRLLPALGMKNTYTNVPSAKMGDYAEGYRKGSPIRMTPAVLSSEAYGIRTTASDMVRFVEANMGTIELQPKIQRAIERTHTGYFKAGPFTQDLIWEQYAYPVSLQKLLEGNSPELFDATPATAITPPQKPQAAAWLNKTGSTNGFGAYVAFVPELRCGIVLLANENYPIKDRVTVAYKILTSLCPSN